MNIRIERFAQGRWHDEGQSALLAFIDARGFDDITCSLICASLLTASAYEGGGYRLSRIEGELQ